MCVKKSNHAVLHDDQTSKQGRARGPLGCDMNCHDAVAPARVHLQ